MRSTVLFGTSLHCATSWFVFRGETSGRENTCFLPVSFLMTRLVLQWRCWWIEDRQTDTQASESSQTAEDRLNNEIISIYSASHHQIKHHTSVLTGRMNATHAQEIPCITVPSSDSYHSWVSSSIQHIPGWIPPWQKCKPRYASRSPLNVGRSVSSFLS